MYKPESCSLLHHRWASADSIFKLAAERVGHIDLQYGTVSVRLITAHFPHSGYPLLEFEACVGAVEDLVEAARRLHLMNIVGVDANAVLGANCLSGLSGNVSSSSRN